MEKRCDGAAAMGDVFSLCDCAAQGREGTANHVRTLRSVLATGLADSKAKRKGRHIEQTICL